MPSSPYGTAISPSIVPNAVVSTVTGRAKTSAPS